MVLFFTFLKSREYEVGAINLPDVEERVFWRVVLRQFHSAIVPHTFRLPSSLYVIFEMTASLNERLPPARDVHATQALLFSAVTS